MIEVALALPVFLLLCGAVIETSRVLAIRIALEVATEDLTETITLRWTELSARGLTQEGVASEADLIPRLARTVEVDFFSSLGRFPGFAPLISAKKVRAEGRVHIDLEPRGVVRVHTALCVPLWFLPEGFVKMPPGELSSARPAGAKADSGPARDCQGRFVGALRIPTLTLRAERALPLPPSHFVWTHGLAMPASIPLVTDPSLLSPPFAASPSGPHWDNLFTASATLAAKIGGSLGGNANP